MKINHNLLKKKKIFFPAKINPTRRLSDVYDGRLTNKKCFLRDWGICSCHTMNGHRMEPKAN